MASLTGHKPHCVVWLTILAFCATQFASSAADAAAFHVLITPSSAEDDLSKSQLTARLEDQPAELLDARSATGDPLVFSILLDVSGSAKDKRSFQERSVLELFRRLSGANSVGYYGEFNDEVFLPHKPATLNVITNTFREHGRYRGGTALNDAVLEAARLVNRTANGTTKRRAVVVLTDGDDNASQSSLKHAIRELQRESVPVFCIGLLGSRSKKEAIAEIHTLSVDTGGIATLITEPQDFISSIVQAIQHQYWITIAGRLNPDGKLHPLSIVSEGKVQVYAPSAVLLRR